MVALDAVTPLVGDINSFFPSDPMVQKTWERRSEYQVIESMKYFLDGMSRIMQPQYIATPQDILHVRIRSSGVCVCVFVFSALVSAQTLC